MLETIAIFTAILLAALLAEPLSERLRLPLSSFLVIIGFIGSEIIVALGFDTGLRWDDFVEIILHLLVPIIIFESAFNANSRALYANLTTILFLAIPAMLIATLITGLLIFIGIGNNLYFPLTTALLTGAIVSATDPVAVVALFKKLGAPDRLNALLEGESLFNDAVAIVAFSILVELSLNSDRSVAVSTTTLLFLEKFIGGVVVGVSVGWLAKIVFGLLKNSNGHTLLGIISAIFVFYISEDLLHVSGAVAVLSTGLLLGDFYRSSPQGDNHFAERFWELSSQIANAILFILVGVTITIAMFTSQWLAMLIGICAAILARLLVIFGLLPALTLHPAISQVRTSEKNVLMWGGLRGAVALALALSIPTAVEGWYTAQSIAYGVVVFTLFFQAPIMERLIKKTI